MGRLSNPLPNRFLSALSVPSVVDPLRACPR